MVKYGKRCVQVTPFDMSSNDFNNLFSELTFWSAVFYFFFCSRCILAPERFFFCQATSSGIIKCARFMHLNRNFSADILIEFN